MRSGAVIKGEISVALVQNLVLFRGSGYQSEDSHENGIKADQQMRIAVHALPAHKLSAVFFYDTAADINRRFVSVGESTAFPGVQLYEAVLQGRIDVLRRPRGANASSAAEDFDYYLKDHDRVVPLWKFYREVFPALEEETRQQLGAFIKANDLRRGNDANVITIIGYYNRMMRAGQALARY